MKKFAISFITLSAVFFIACEEKNNETANKTLQKNEASQNKSIVKFDPNKINKNLSYYGVSVNKNNDILNITISYTFSNSKKPSAPAYAESIYRVAKYICSSDYPDLGKLKLSLKWRDNKNSDFKSIAELEGVKADFCVGYDKAKGKEKTSKIIAGYIMLNNFSSFPKKEVKDIKALNSFCETDMIAKFCKELI